MRALQIAELGSIDNLYVGEAPSPRLGEGQVRVGVKAAGVNFPDILMSEGKYQVKPDLPFIPGLELAGEVLECAQGVSHVKTGDRVMAFARRGGAYAAEAVLPGGIVTRRRGPRRAHTTGHSTWRGALGRSPCPLRALPCDVPM